MSLASIRPAMLDFIKARTGGGDSSLTPVVAPTSADHPAETYLPAVAQELADSTCQLDHVMKTHVEFGYIPAHKIAACMRHDQWDAHPEAAELLDDVMSLAADKTGLDASFAVYEPGAEPGIFAVDLHRSCAPSEQAVFGEYLTTLFVDTTPGADGVQLFFATRK